MAQVSMPNNRVEHVEINQPGPANIDEKSVQCSRSGKLADDGAGVVIIIVVFFEPQFSVRDTYTICSVSL